MKKLWYVIVFASTLQFSHYTIAQQKEKPSFITQVEEVKEYKLSNGLQVLLIPDETQNNLLVNIVYHVGSKHEGYGEKGMAHLLEHMLFKSTKNLGDIKKMISDKGGNANGTTWYDRTNYYEIFPSSDENLKWALEMEADRMINATILQEDLDKEFSVVRNEFEIGESRPQGVLMEKTISTAYMWHNYGLSTIGSKEDIERVKTPQLRKFYEKYYQPDNATLIIAGKFDEKKALQYVEEYFSTIPKPERILDQIYTAEPAQDGERYIEVLRAGDTQHINVLYHSAAYADKDFAALAALENILNNDPSGYLYKALVDTKKVSGLWGFSPTVRDASFVLFNFDIPNDKDVKASVSEVKAELDKIATINYTQEDLERAKANLLKSVEATKNSTLGYGIGLTEIVGAGDYRLFNLYRDNVEQLTLDDVKRVAKEYFKANNRTVGVFVPTKDEVRVKPKEFLAEDITALVQNYQGKETAEQLRPFEASIANLEKNYTHGAISNGLKYGVIDKDIKGEKVMLTLNLPISNAKELQNKQYIGYFTAYLLKAGTKNLTKQQINDKLDLLKSNVNFSFQGQTLSIGISGYKNSIEETMKLVKEIIDNPIFPENEFDKAIAEHITYYESNLNDPQSIAFTDIERMTSNEPAGSIFYTPTAQEQIDNTKKVKLSEVKDFFKLLGANNGTSSAIGFTDTAEVKKLLEETFGTWNSKAKYEKAYPTFFQSKKEKKVVEVKDKENAAAVGAISFEMNKESKDYPAVVFANEILGGGGFMTARIPQRLREKEGISYGAGSFLSVPTDPKTKSASFGIYAFLNPTKRDAVEVAINEELAKIVNDGVTEEEVKNSKTSWKNSRQTNLGSDGYLLGLSQTFLQYDIPFSDFDKLNDQIQKLSIKEINDAVKKYLKPSNFSTIYVGDFDKK